MLFNAILIGALLGMFSVQIENTYDYTIKSLYQLVRSIVKENLAVLKQQYFAVLFYLFLTILLANMAGMIPFSFTVTSSFVVTLLLSSTHFIAINVIGAVRHR